MIARNHPIKIFIEAKGGISSASILKKLPTWIEKYKPHLVVSMIGTNDMIYNFRFRKNFCEKTETLRILKISCWVIDATKSLFSKKSIEYLVNTKEIHRTKITLSEVFDNKDWKGLLDQLSVLGVAERAYIQVGLVSDKCIRIPDIRAIGAVEICLSMIKDAYNSYDYDNRVIEVYFYLISRIFKFDLTRAESLRANLIQDIVDKNTKIDDAILPMVIGQGEHLRNPEIMRFIKQYAELYPQSLEEGVYTNLEMIHELITKNNAFHLIMSYPTWSSSRHARMFGLEKVTQGLNYSFLENKVNFEEALKQFEYDEIFIDRFAGTWGHTTSMGSNIIMNNVFPKVIEICQFMLSSDESILQNEGCASATKSQ